MSNAAIPEKIGRYRVLRHLATGGMGEVFLARQEGLSGFSKLVVVKRLLAHYARDPAVLQMFLNEARFAAMLQHPNVVQVFDLGEDQGEYFIAMEYVHGASLRGVKQALTTQGRALLPQLAAQLCAQALRGLHHAHTLVDDGGTELKLVHRDVSPDNLLVGYDGVVKVVDFGIAKATSVASSTGVGTVKGKFAYMAPEYLQGEAIDARADVYSMGVVMYELLGGQRPFKAASDPALILAILKEVPVPLSQRNNGVPAPLEAVVSRALEKDPTRRYQSAQQMAQDLERIVAGQVTATTIHSLLLALYGEEAARRPSGELPAVKAPAGTAQQTQLPRPKPDAPSTLIGNILTVSKVVPDAAPGATKESPALAPAEAPAAEFSDVDLPDQEALTDGAAAPASSKRALLGAAFVVSVVVGVGLAVALTREPPTPVEPATPVERPQPVEPPQPVESPKPVEPPQPVEPPKPVEPPQPVEPPKPVEPPQPVEPPKPVELPKPVEHKTGRVQVIALPWAEVRWSGRALGVTPMDPIELPSGPQTLELRNDELGVVKKVKVTVPAGGTTKLRVDLME